MPRLSSVARRRFGVAPLLASILASTLLAWTTASAAPLRTPRHLPFSPGEVVIIGDDLELGTAGGGGQAKHPRLAAALAGLGIEQARRLGRHTWLLTSRRPGFDPAEASRAIQATGAVRAASPNYRFSLFATPNDLYLIYQYYVDDGGGADVRLPAAWDVTQGDPSVVIAIVDTGVDTGHPDLASKIWQNPGETAGNGIDDDGNDLIDDVVGWDFGVGDNNPNPEYTMDASGLDVGFHGTFCAGIAAAATNNDEGIAGAGWNCRIMPLKVSHPDSGITSSAIAGAVEYAVDKGASVISMSFGGPGDPGVPEFFQALVDLATFSGAVCVAAAGNDGVSTPVYPAACDRVLAVGATDDTNARASFSNWGPWVDVAAPGAAMWSSICRNYTLTELDQLFYILFFGWDGLSPYMFGDGTSFACPLTAGVVGLVRSLYPALPPPMVMRHVIQTGDVVAFDLPVGTKVNALRAVGVPTAVVEAGAASPPARVSAAPNPAPGATEIRYRLATAGTVRLAVYDVSGRQVRAWPEHSVAAGPHAIRWDGRDDRGDRLPASVYFVKLQGPGGTLQSKVVLLER
jgi:subtilisin family serine protease